MVLAGIGTDKGPAPCLPALNHIAICLNASKTVSTLVSTPAALLNWFKLSIPLGPWNFAQVNPKTVIALAASKMPIVLLLELYCE